MRLATSSRNGLTTPSRTLNGTPSWVTSRKSASGEVAGPSSCCWRSSAKGCRPQPNNARICSAVTGSPTVKTVDPVQARTDPNPRRLTPLGAAGRQPGVTFLGRVQGCDLPGQVVITGPRSELVDAHRHTHPKGYIPPGRSGRPELLPTVHGVCRTADLGIGWGVRETGRNRQCDRRADWSGLGPASVRGDGDESVVGAARGATVGVGCAGGAAATSTSPWAVLAVGRQPRASHRRPCPSTRAVTKTSEPGPAPRLTAGGEPAVGGGLRHPAARAAAPRLTRPPGPAISIKSTARRHTCSARMPVRRTPPALTDQRRCGSVGSGRYCARMQAAVQTRYGPPDDGSDR